MAVIHKSKSALQLQLKQAKKEDWKDRRMTWHLLKPVLMFALYELVITALTQDYPTTNFLLQIVGGWKLLNALGFEISYYFGEPSDKVGILKAGIKGERKARFLVSLLPKEYHIFPDVELYYQGQKSEMDLVIVGPTGVFIVEVKNYKGYLQGDWGEHDLTQLKKGRKHQKAVYNPVKQVGTHVYRLAGYLKEQNIEGWIQGCVLFTNFKLRLEVTDKSNVDIPVFQIPFRGNLLQYIKKYKCYIPPEIREHIVAALEKTIGQ